MTFKKLSKGDLADYREKLRKEQGNRCPITGWHLTDDIVADHCHKSGMMRAALPRWVNAVLGRVENWASRVGGGVPVPTFLRKCADYIEHYQLFPSFVFHPLHKTPEEKKEAAKKKAAKRRAAKKAEARQ
ncbi:endonuclease domain-containing protein [Burkholderia pyrrocinia]|uniref:endonuclease domain-containing protein n=1 Tax=Burkholderia pyrrocinia TaxID=60550 RepID=UPI00158EF2C8|nr:endonuclease domain-containing protein [Burkholderia pyrrocinia]